MVFSKFFDDVKTKSSHTTYNPQYGHSSAPRKRKNRTKRDPTHHEKDALSVPSVEARGPKKRKRKRPPKTSTILKHRKSTPPSAEALALSATLKELSSRKQLKDALKVYWDPSNDRIRDGHHGCIMVDCCARCGDIERGEEVVAALVKAGMHVNVETNTALLKGYSHSGMIEKAANLFREMCKSKSRRDRPNVRTLNTLLRGCLWTATSLSHGPSRRPVGGVVTSEEAVALYRSSQAGDNEQGDAGMDSSSYEYSIMMMCQNLLYEAANVRLREMKQRLGLSDNRSNVDRAAVESLAVCLLSLARCSAILGKVVEASDAAQRSVEACNESISLLNETMCVTEDSLNEHKQDESTKTKTCGGKRAWRERNQNSFLPATDRRATSNSRFRTHRLTEIRSESQQILVACQKDQPRLESSTLACFLITRVLYFSGGGTTDLSATRSRLTGQGSGQTVTETRVQLLNALWHSFGLKAALTGSRVELKKLSRDPYLGEDECGKLVEAVGLTGISAIDSEGFMDFDSVFTPLPPTDIKKHASVKTSLCIELGSGFGDWIVGQAQLNPANHYVAVEMRSDRVAQTFSKALLYNGGSPLENLCCVGSEAGCFLRDRVRRGSVSTVFVNHPEPPTQTHGSNSVDLTGISHGGDELAHMLNSETLLSAAHSLEEIPEAKIVIVTDNRWYARLICATLLKVVRENRGLVRSSKLGSGFRKVEVFPGEHNGDDDVVVLYEGQPSAAIGHVLSTRGDENYGASYFDRLWRSGAGSHAENKKRYIIVMEKSCHSTGRMKHSHKPESIPRKKKRKSKAKQQRRNERRLMKQVASK